MQIINLFNEPLITTELSVDNIKILNYLKKVKYVETIKTREKIASCNMSERMDLLNDLPLLKKQISNSIKDFIENILEYEINFKIPNSWAIKINPNGFSHSHYHAHSFISGVYYPIGNEGFKVGFTRKDINKFWDIPRKKFNPFNSNKASVKVTDNMLVLFLSDIDHEVLPNTSSIDRYSIAFTVNPIGKMGVGDSTINFKC